MLPLAELDFVDATLCQPGDLVFTKLRGEEQLIFVFDWAGNKHYAALSGPIRYAVAQLGSLPKTAYKVRSVTVDSSISLDPSSLHAATQGMSAGNLYFDKGRRGIILSYHMDELVVGLDGQVIADPWSAGTLLATNWQIAFPEELGGTVICAQTSDPQ